MFLHRLPKLSQAAKPIIELARIHSRGMARVAVFSHRRHGTMHAPPCRFLRHRWQTTETIGELTSINSLGSRGTVDETLRHAMCSLAFAAMACKSLRIDGRPA